MIEMLRVTQPGDINAVAILAREIWEEHYVPIVGRAQVDFMLGTLQSASAIAQQIAGGFEYYSTLYDGQRAGYFAFVVHPTEFLAQLSKIYVRRSQRGRGIGRAIVGFVEERCSERGIRELWLNVNRHNAGAIAFYQNMGFTRSGSIVQQIGNGFVMDDYKMVKPINIPAPVAQVERQ